MEEFQEISKILPFLIPVFILELGLLIFALVDIIKRKHVTGNNKVIWILVIVFFQIIGPAVYLLAGRKEDVVDSDKD